MNISNKLCSYMVATICGICLFAVTAAMDVTINHASAGPEVNFILVGTVLSDEGNSVAIFEDNKTNRQKFYRLGDTIEGGRLTKILKDRVFLTKDDVEVELKIGYGTSRGGNMATDSAGTAGVAVNNTPQVSTPPATTQKERGYYKVRRSELKMLDGSALELDSHVTTRSDGGFHVGAVQKGSLLSRMGLRTGDTIKNINNNVPDPGLSLSETVNQVLLEGARMLRLEVERGEEDHTEPVYIEVSSDKTMEE